MPVLHGSVVSDPGVYPDQQNDLIDRLMVDRLVMSGVIRLR